MRQVEIAGSYYELGLNEGLSGFRLIGPSSGPRCSPDRETRWSRALHLTICALDHTLAEWGWYLQFDGFAAQNVPWGNGDQPRC